MVVVNTSGMHAEIVANSDGLCWQMGNLVILNVINVLGWNEEGEIVTGKARDVSIMVIS